MIIVQISGGLGNQLFQYFFVKNLMTYHSNVYIDIEFYNYQSGLIDIRKFELDFFKNFELKIIKNKFTENYWKLKNSKITKIIWYLKQLTSNEGYFIFKENLFSMENILLKKIKRKYFIGYWQKNLTPKDITKFNNFINCLVLKKKYYRNDYFEYLSSITSSSINIAVCIRRMDFLNFNSNSSLNYFNNSILFFKKKYPKIKFLIFSDDMNWCKKNFNGSEFYFVDRKSNISFESILAIGLCDHAIISRSTHNLCASLLIKNKNKIIIYNQDWDLGKSFNSLLSN